MKIIVAKEAGFCFGVRRAVDKTLAATKTKGEVQTLGSLIHNPDYIKYLDSKGVTIAHNPSEVTAEKVIIRAHGVPTGIKQNIVQKGSTVIDATCPFVKVAQRSAENFYKEGYQLILLGKASHPEIIGIRSYAPDAIVVTNIEEIPKLPRNTKMALVSQTTQSVGKFHEISEYLKANFDQVQIKNTICDSTEKKQKEAAEISKNVDLMLVIGGRNSSNTCRLAEVCSKHTTTKHVENVNEVDSAWLEGVKAVGVTAGASTPDSAIEEVLVCLKGDR